MNEKLEINNKWLIFARKINRLTRYDVSIALNIPVHTIEDWEHSNYMNYEDMKKIMGYCNNFSKYWSRNNTPFTRNLKL